MTKTGEAKHWIDKNLWAILAVGLGLYGGYLTGQVTMAKDIEHLQRQVDANRTVINEMHPRTNKADPG